MAVITQATKKKEAVQRAIPTQMRAAVYHGQNDVRLETVPVPAVGPDELLIRVHACGICGTDLKKIATGSHSAPRIFGHEIAGEVVAVGANVSKSKPGDRVMAFHHIPCGKCFYCRHKVFAQCVTYKKVGLTAGYEPSGGGFAEYVRASDWIVREGVVKIPNQVSYEQAAFIEPINTCMKAIEMLHLEAGETVLVIGQGPIGLMLGVLAQRKGVHVVGSDMFAPRLALSKSFGIQRVINASKEDASQRARELTEGRGADAVILAVAGNSLIQPALDAARPGGRILLFAQTVHCQATFDPASVCVEEKTLLGSYSASADFQEESVNFVFGGEVDLTKLISHRFPLERAVEALELAAHPQPDSMKIVISPSASASRASETTSQ